MADHDHRYGTHPDGAAASRLVTTDPVCGLTVKADTAFRMAYAGNTYLFCGEDCLERFQSVPERYLEPEAPAIKNRQPASSRGTPCRKGISAPHPGSVTEPGQRIGTMSNAEALRLGVQMLDNLHAQIRATDEKIRALFAGSAIFVAALTLTGQQALSQLKSDEQGTLIPLIAYAVLLATLAFSLISAVLALRPRLSHHEVAERSLFYFGDIHGMEAADYVRAFMGLSEQAALDQVLTQVHVNAKVVQKKYLWTRRAATGFVAATVVWLAVQLAFVAGDAARGFAREYFAGSTNTASVQGNEADPSTANDTATASTMVNPAADLAVTKADSPDPVTAGQNLTYTITVNNNGPSAAANAALNYAVPANTTFQSLTAPAGWSCTTPAAGGTGAVHCGAASLASGATASFTLAVKVNTGTAPGTTITSTATASSDTTDPNSANHSATATTAVVKANQLYRLGVTVTGRGKASVTSSPAGISCPRDCSDSYAGRTSVTLTATPSGSRFTGWGGDCQQAGTKRSCVVNMTADRSVKATFSKK